MGPCHSLPDQSEIESLDESSDDLSEHQKLTGRYERDASPPQDADEEGPEQDPEQQMETHAKEDQCEGQPEQDQPQESPTEERVPGHLTSETSPTRCQTDEKELGRRLPYSKQRNKLEPGLLGEPYAAANDRFIEGDLNNAKRDGVSLQSGTPSFPVNSAVRFSDSEVSFGPVAGDEGLTDPLIFGHTAEEFGEPLTRVISHSDDPVDSLPKYDNPSGRVDCEEPIFWPPTEDFGEPLTKVQSHSDDPLDIAFRFGESFDPLGDGEDEDLRLRSLPGREPYPGVLKIPTHSLEQENFGSLGLREADATLQGRVAAAEISFDSGEDDRLINHDIANGPLLRKPIEGPPESTRDSIKPVLGRYFNYEALDHTFTKDREGNPIRLFNEEARDLKLKNKERRGASLYHTLPSTKRNRRPRKQSVPSNIQRALLDHIDQAKDHVVNSAPVAQVTEQNGGIMTNDEQPARSRTLTLAEATRSLVGRGSSSITPGEYSPKEEEAKVEENAAGPSSKSVTEPKGELIIRTTTIGFASADTALRTAWLNAHKHQKWVLDERDGTLQMLGVGLWIKGMDINDMRWFTAAVPGSNGSQGFDETEATRPQEKSHKGRPKRTPTGHRTRKRSSTVIHWSTGQFQLLPPDDESEAEVKAGQNDSHEFRGPRP
ncbi:hypothetical protein K402DRAFT_420935 [Aulographum hederae CBS 113979]|uniref:Uncharacterized protein n=1 Tax=Aulographum hederae CBS 113979 TaxID=1176131 RepID=A0A6G1H1J5_9PEZI|nr:hypothetical protein K402DRAFT_420935 [Aulographum hederae CBS 113979]